MSLPASETVIVAKPAITNTESGEGKYVEKSRQCPICHVYYKYGNSYWQHVRYVHASFLSQCVICEKSYKRKTMAKHHILHSHKIAWHLCSNYVRKIKKSDLTKNQDIKNEKENRNSKLKYFKKKTLHLISSFNCYDCSGSFLTIRDLFDHVKCHRGKENYVKYEDEDDENVENVQIIQNNTEDVEVGEVEDTDDVEDVNGINHVNGVDNNHDIHGMGDIN